ncbi:MAG: hypothetical protein ACOZF2_08015 [Thermodesulfobacteriota bacterium]
MEPDPVFSLLSWKNFRLRNRLGVAPMTRMSSVKDSLPRQDVLEFLARRAQNGAALVYTEALVTDYESAQGYPGQSRLLTQRQINAMMPTAVRWPTATVSPTKSSRRWPRSSPRTNY